jgi:hypothetical protein
LGRLVSPRRRGNAWQLFLPLRELDPSAVAAQQAIQVDAGPQSSPTVDGVIRRYGGLETQKMLGRQSFQPSNARGSGTRTDKGERTEHANPQERKNVEDLEDFATTELGGRVVNPNPKAILNPLAVGNRIRCGSDLKRSSDPAFTFPKNSGIFDPLGKIRERHEF